MIYDKTGDNDVKRDGASRHSFYYTFSFKKNHRSLHWGKRFTLLLRCSHLNRLVRADIDWHEEIKKRLLD